MPKLTADEERQRLHEIWILDNPDEEVFKLLADRNKLTRRLRGKLAIDLVQLQPDDIADMQRLKRVLIWSLRDDDEEVRGKVAIACVFLDVPEAVPIILEQLEQGVDSKTAIPYLKALCAFQDPASEDRVSDYAVGLSSGDESGAGTLLWYAVQVLGFIHLAKIKKEKMDVQNLWNYLR